VIGKPRRVPPLVGILCLALAVSVASGCVQHEVDDRADASGGEPASANADGDNGNGTYSAPELPSGPAVFVAQNLPYTAYNNTTAQSHGDGNTAVLNQVLVDPFVVDGNGAFLLNTDVMESAALTSQDPQVVTYKIKPNVKWSDGAPWDCDDFYLAWLAGSGKAVVKGSDGEPVSDPTGRQATYFTPATTRGYQWATGECRDDLTFVETYSAPYVEWRQNYVHNAILPAHVLERVTGIPDITALRPDSAQADLQKAGDAWNRGWLGFNPDTMPASGPYRIAGSPPGGQTVLVRNERWVGHPGGPDRIVLTVTDTAGAVAGVQHRALTVVAPPADPVPAGQLRALSGQGVVFEARGGSSTENLNLNLARPLFQDADVRTAFAQCIDRNELVEELVREVLPAAQPQGSLTFLPGDANYEDRYGDKMSADPQKAQLTLERTGWVLGPDGVYSRNGQRLTFSISHDGAPTNSRAVELIRKQCRQAGMEILDGAAPAGMDAVLGHGTFDVALTTSSLVPPVSSMTDRYGSRGAKNYQHYSNPEVDDALGVAETEYAESSQAAARLTADRLIADDLVAFPLFQVPVMWSYSSNIHNVYLHNQDGITWNANEWTN